MSLLNKIAKLSALVIGLLCCIYPFVFETRQISIFITIGCAYFICVWILANLENKSFNGTPEQWKERKNILIGLGLCVVTGLALLFYYEQQIPRYTVAFSDIGDYKVPPQLSRSQLREYGADCNTYGNTQCSLAVFSKLVKMDPRDYKALANLAMAQTHLGFHSDAAFNFDVLIEKGFVTYDVFKFYGDSLLALKQKGQAKKAYEQALMLNPELKEVENKLKDL